jgi:hypothetical protein
MKARSRAPHRARPRRRLRDVQARAVNGTALLTKVANLPTLVADAHLIKIQPRRRSAQHLPDAFLYNVSLYPLFVRAAMVDRGSSILPCLPWFSRRRTESSEMSVEDGNAVALSPVSTRPTCLSSKMNRYQPKLACWHRAEDFAPVLRLPAQTVPPLLGRLR